MKRRNWMASACVIGCGLCGATSAASDADDWAAAAQSAFTLDEIPVKIPEVPWCPADWDHSGTVDVSDLYPFLNEWYSGSCGGDVNWDGRLSVQDIFDFLQMLAVGHCPPVGQPVPDKK
ncbi:MAG: hypothetical protein IT438_12150 [Phycisphaerales bacterium]|nr:hypothetical protein [Phycisphaerales bacterium]